MTAHRPMHASVLSAALAILTAAGLASAQPCTPSWDTAPGLPGIAGGYAAPVRAWNGGGGERVYVGGSFTSAGGSAANRYLAAYDASTNTWSPLGSGIGGGFTNAFMTALLPFNPGSGERLVAAGFFDNAGGVPETASLAMWNGQSWEAMGTTWTGTTRGSIWSLAAWNGRLYVGGGVVNQPAQIAGLPWAGMASWDGTSWATHISSTAGFSPNVFALVPFDDGSGEALFAVGRFSSIDNIPGTSCVARWNGSSWSAVGGGLTPTSPTSGLEAATIFDDGSGPALYVAGGAVTGTGVPVCNVARWNGQAWSAVGGQLGTGRLTSIAVFDDGSGAKLYVGGTAMVPINYIARYENGNWATVGGGIPVPAAAPFPSVFGLGVVGDRLYAAGNFTEIGSPAAPASGLAAWTSCATTTCYANCDGSTQPPVLNVNDFVCFQQSFAAGDPYANCDGSVTLPILNVNDFVCFQQRFAAGCP